jgi:hypothetical protein
LQRQNQRKTQIIAETWVATYCRSAIHDSSIFEPSNSLAAAVCWAGL